MNVLSVSRLNSAKHGAPSSMADGYLTRYRKGQIAKVAFNRSFGEKAGLNLTMRVDVEVGIEGGRVVHVAIVQQKNGRYRISSSQSGRSTLQFTLPKELQNSWPVERTWTKCSVDIVNGDRRISFTPIYEDK